MTKKLMSAFVGAALAISPTCLLSEESHVGRTTFGLGVGVNTKEDGKTAPSVAASINYRLSERAAIGVLAEYAFEDLNEWVVGVPVRAFVGEGWVLTAMPGVEIAESKEEPLIRLGVGYEFEFDSRSLTPEVNVDFVDGEVTFVYGLVFGF